MIKSSFSQDGYPKKIVIDKDTVCAVTIAQLDSINKEHIDKKECYELRDSLNSQIRNHIVYENDQRQIIINQDKELYAKNNIIQQKDVIIDSSDKLLKNQERKIKWLKFQRTFFPILGIAIGIIGTVLISK